MQYLPGFLQSTVENDAPCIHRAVLPGSGLGLIGLKERVELLGGEFTTRHTADGGFSVSARLPT